jgi:hypothetical protein
MLLLLAIEYVNTLNYIVIRMNYVCSYAYDYSVMCAAQICIKRALLCTRGTLEFGQ